MTGYTRQSVADIINGSNITAPPLNAEFNQLAAAFEGADGHAHDGTAGNGPKINLQTSVDGYLMPVNGGTGGRNNTTATTNPTAASDALAGYAPGSIWINSTTGRIFVCAVNTNSAAVWLEVVGVRNGNSITPVSTNTVDIGSNAVRYKDLYLAGTALVGSLSSGPATVDSLSVTGATTATGLVTANGGFLNNGVFTTTGTANLNGNVNIGDGTADVVTFGGRIAGNLVPGTDDASDLGTSTLEWRNIWVDGTANIDNLVADAVTVSGGTIDGTVIGGTTAQTVRGTTITALTGFVGNLTGNVTGNTAGTHTGPVTGDVTGNVTGNVTAATGTSSFNNVTINGSLDLNSGTVGTITGLSAPVNATDAATKQYVDTADALKVNKSGDTVTGNLTLSGGAKVTGLPTPTLSSDAASKSYVDTAIANLINTAPGTLDTLNEIATALGNDPNFAATMTTELAKKLDKTGGSMTGAIDMGTNKITSLAAPTANGDATNKSYVDTAVGTKVSKAGDTMSGALAMGGNKVTGLGTPTADTDASTKAYVDTAAATKLNLSGGTMTGAIAMGSNKITGLGAPTVGTDATTKDYVDGILGSATSAATSAANAATSATAAATSASNAATSASQAETAYDQFDDRYLGAKSANPTVDNDGNALLVGALYWNSSVNEMRVWNGSTWQVSYLPATGYVSKTGDTITGDMVISTNSTGDALRINQTGAGNALVVEDSANPDATPFLINGAGNVVLGHTSSLSIAGRTSLLQTYGANIYTGARYNSASSAGANFSFARSRSATVGSFGVVSANDIIASINFSGDDGSAFVDAASIIASVDGTPGTGDMPGRLEFRTTAGGAASPTERMRITSAGNVGIGTSSPTRRVTIFNNDATNNTSVPTLSLHSDRNDRGASLDVVRGALSSVIGLAISTSDGADPVERMRINPNGNVGIGTNAPAAPLDVNSTGANTQIHVRNSGALGMSLYALSGSYAVVNSGTASTPLLLAVNGTEHMRVNVGGNVGINQTAPATKLDVNGAVANNIVAVAALDIDCSAGNYFTKTISANSTFTFSNAPASRAYAFTLELTHTSGTVTWPTTVKWPKDTAPTLTTGKTHLLIFVTDDGGTRWRGASLADYVN